MSDIDIYNYPEGADSQTLWRYQAAVMNAAADGKLVQAATKEGDIWCTVMPKECPPFWDWHRQKYRIARDPWDEIAPGHNPDKLTVRQVPSGRRLLSIEEQAQAINPDKTDVLAYIRSRAQWMKCYCGGGFHFDDTYATTKPPGYYLPQPRTVREWLETIPCPKWRAAKEESCP